MSGRTRYPHSRRSILAKTGVLIGGMASLAGCSDAEDPYEDGENGGDGGSESGSDDGETTEDGIVNRELTSAINEPLSADYGWNYYNDILSTAASEFLYGSAFVYTPNNDEILPEGAQSWDVDGNELWIEYRDDWYWHNEDEVTTEDIAIGFDYHFWLQENDGSRDEGILEDDGYEIESEKTATLIFRDEVPHHRFWGIDAIVRNPYAANRNVHGEWHDQLGSVDADTDEWLELWEDFIYEDDDFYPPVGNGPFEYVEHSDNTLLLERFEDHFAADTINFSNIRLDYHEDEFIAFTEGQIDYTDVNMPVHPNDEDLMPESWEY
jgi:ABC-type transport system substrate-binding protein